MRAQLLDADHADSYWAFRPQGGCTIGGTSYDNSNFPDGKVVEKGAQAYVLRSIDDAHGPHLLERVRQLFGAPARCSTSARPRLEGRRPTLGMTRRDAQRRLRQLAEGHRQLETRTSMASRALEMRPSAHGDVVHSRPIALDFGTTRRQRQVDFAESKVVVFYGGNDGILRAINGNRDDDLRRRDRRARKSGRSCRRSSTARSSACATTTRRSTSGATPNEDDDPTTTHAGAAAQALRHGRPDHCLQEAARCYVGMRRGGRALYAFNIDQHRGQSRRRAGVAPVEPRLLWKVGCPTTCSETTMTADSLTTARPISRTSARPGRRPRSSRPRATRSGATADARSPC